MKKIQYFFFCTLLLVSCEKLRPTHVWNIHLNDGTNDYKFGTNYINTVHIYSGTVFYNFSHTNIFRTEFINQLPNTNGNYSAMKLVFNLEVLDSGLINRFDTTRFDVKTRNTSLINYLKNRSEFTSRSALGYLIYQDHQGALWSAFGSPSSLIKIKNASLSNNLTEGISLNFTFDATVVNFSDTTQKKRIYGEGSLPFGFNK